MWNMRAGKRQLPGAYYGSFVGGWVDKKKEWETTKTSFSIQKGHENLYKYQDDLVIQSSRCKRGIKKKVRHINDEIYLVVMMSDLYPADIDIILDGNSYKISNYGTFSSWCYLKWWTDYLFMDLFRWILFI